MEEIPGDVGGGNGEEREHYGMSLRTQFIAQQKACQGLMADPLWKDY